MSLRLRLLLLMVGIYCVGGYLLTRWALDQVRPRYLESMEESLVDTSVLLASALEAQPEPVGGVDGDLLRRMFAETQRHSFEAKVFALRKTAVDLRVYLTDARGCVVFDSAGRDEGRDFSRWNDVWHTLRGEYGARSSRDIAGNDDTQVIYVAAPVRQDGRIVGVVSVGKPTRGVSTLVTAARRRNSPGGGAGRLRVVASAAADGLVGDRAIGTLDRLRPGGPGPPAGPATETPRSYAA